MADRVEDLLRDLQNAISNGKVTVAQELVKQLSEMKARLEIKSLPGPVIPPHEKIRICVFVEDRESSGVNISVQVHLSDTIWHLKRQMMLNYGFPEQVQKWIVGQRIRQDHETLYGCGVRTAESAVFLYLVSPKSVPLTRSQFEAHRLNVQRDIRGETSPATDTLSQTSSVAPPVTIPTPVSSTTPSDVTTVGSTSSTSESSSSTSVNGDFSFVETEEQEGWACDRCTFINIPTRPGCVQCGGDRPDDYMIPMNYIAPPNEQERILRECQADEQAQLSEEINMANLIRAAQNVHEVITVMKRNNSLLE